MILAGLTGSIGMGKSTTAALFTERGVPVHDADAAVHALYRAEGVAAVAALFPEALVEGAIDRAILSRAVMDDPEAMRRLESVVHPLVRAREDAFLADARRSGAPLVVLDIPLLFETRGEGRVDLVLVVSAPEAVQKARVLARPGMTEERFLAIRAKQMPDAEKRRRAHHVIETGDGLEAARRAVRGIIRVAAGMGGARAGAG